MDVDAQNCLFNLVVALKLIQILKAGSNLSIGMKRKVPLMVDVDDKNCLAELTVALKLNHGVRQRLYIVAGLFFFASFFCRSKRKKDKISGVYPDKNGDTSKRKCI